jgi:hypothetical protein
MHCPGKLKKNTKDTDNFVGKLLGKVYFLRNIIMSNPRVLTPINGSIALPNSYVQNFHQIVTRTGQVLLDVSAFGGTGWRSRITGLKDMSGTATGYLSGGTDSNPGFSGAFTAGSMTVTFDVGCSVTFNAYIGSQTISQNYDGKDEISVEFAYADNGTPPTFTWAAS